MGVTDKIVGDASGFCFMPQSRERIDKTDIKVAACCCQRRYEVPRIPQRNLAVSSIRVAHQAVEYAMAIRQVHNPWAHPQVANGRSPICERPNQLLPPPWPHPIPNGWHSVHCHRTLRRDRKQESVWSDFCQCTVRSMVAKPAPPEVHCFQK